MCLCIGGQDGHLSLLCGQERLTHIVSDNVLAEHVLPEF